MALSLGLSLEHRTHTRSKLEPDLVQEVMQPTARVGWVCWGNAHRDVDCDIVHNQPVLVRTQRRAQTWVE